MTDVVDGVAIPMGSYVRGKVEFVQTPEQYPVGHTPTMPEDFKPFVFDDLATSVPSGFGYVDCEVVVSNWHEVMGTYVYDFNYSANNVVLEDGWDQSQNGPLPEQTDYTAAAKVVAASVCYVDDNFTGKSCLACKMVDGRYALVAINDGTAAKIPLGSGLGDATDTFNFTPSPLPSGNTPEPPTGFLSNFKFTNGIVPSEAPKLNILNGTIQVKDWSYEEGVARYEVAIMVGGVDIMGVPTVLAAGDIDVNIPRAT